MAYKLLIGNNFILENPKKVNFLNSEIFSVDEDIDGPYIDTQLIDQNGTKIIEIIKNNITFCDFGSKKLYFSYQKLLVFKKKK